MTQVPTQQKSSYPLFIAFQSKEKHKRVRAMLHVPGMSGSKAPASKPHLCRGYIVLHRARLECAKAAWPNWQPASQTQCLHSVRCLFPGQHEEWLAEQPNASSRASSQASGLCWPAQREQMGRGCYFWGREGGNNPWLPAG